MFIVQCPGPSHILATELTSINILIDAFIKEVDCLLLLERGINLNACHCLHGEHKHGVCWIEYRRKYLFIQFVDYRSF